MSTMLMCECKLAEIVGIPALACDRPATQEDFLCDFCRENGCSRLAPAGSVPGDQK